MNKVLIMAGGTGGHVFPALACAQEFKQRGYQVHWLGAPQGIENDLVPAAGIPLHHIQIGGLRGKGLKALLMAPFRLAKALWQALAVMRQVKPVCVLGLGGYVTGPGGLAARLQGIPLIIHEQNAVAGTTNRLLAPLAQCICEGFPNTFKNRKRCHTTGNPVRSELFLTEPHPLPTGRAPHLLVLGGSLGAEPLNRLLPEALKRLPEDQRPEVVHQTGKQHAGLTLERYQTAEVRAEVVPFITDMARAYQWADAVVCRAGALTVSELAAAGLPALLIPLPHAIDDHQTYNAQFLAHAGAALLLPQAQLDADTLAKHLSEVLMQPATLHSMGDAARHLARPEATRVLVDLCLETAHG